MNAQQKALKILINSLCYGIFLELNCQDGSQELIAYGDKKFKTFGKYEEPGKYFFDIGI